MPENDLASYYDAELDGMESSGTGLELNKDADVDHAGLEDFYTVGVVALCATKWKKAASLSEVRDCPH